MQPVQPMLTTSHCVTKSISVDTENYFQLIRGTNPSKKPNPGQQPKEKIRVKIRQAEHYCTTDISRKCI